MRDGVSGGGSGVGCAVVDVFAGGDQCGGSVWVFSAGGRFGVQWGGEYLQIFVDAVE